MPQLGNTETSSVAEAQKVSCVWVKLLIEYRVVERCLRAENKLKSRSCSHRDRSEPARISNFLLMTSLTNYTNAKRGREGLEAEFHAMPRMANDVVRSHFPVYRSLHHFSRRFLSIQERLGKNTFIINYRGRYAFSSHSVSLRCKHRLEGLPRSPCSLLAGPERKSRSLLSHGFRSGEIYSIILSGARDHHESCSVYIKFVY